jgi:hypothetical protein
MAYYADAWIERLREQLPAQVVVTQPSKGTIRTTGEGQLAGSSSFDWLPLFLRLPFPRRLLVQGFFENALDSLQNQMTYATGTEAKRRVRVREGQIQLEYVDDAGTVVHALRAVPYDPPT